ncbi:hypothetical protein GCM10022240_11870 [Microbacterium kribbense]|uniref:Uncharacterized protein n=1 Tax=Microbacterium kribbense TaxID=433645 RepID=A0ABP7GDK1_9MICO
MGESSGELARDLSQATIRELLIALEQVEKRRESGDCFSLRSRERALTAELARRRQNMNACPRPASGRPVSPAGAPQKDTPLPSSVE